MSRLYNIVFKSNCTIFTFYLNKSFPCIHKKEAALRVNELLSLMLHTRSLKKAT